MWVLTECFAFCGEYLLEEAFSCCFFIWGCCVVFLGQGKHVKEGYSRPSFCSALAFLYICLTKVWPGCLFRGDNWHISGDGKHFWHCSSLADAVLADSFTLCMPMASADLHTFLPVWVIFTQFHDHSTPGIVKRIVIFPVRSYWISFQNLCNHCIHGQEHAHSVFFDSWWLRYVFNEVCIVCDELLQ